LSKDKVPFWKIGWFWALLVLILILAMPTVEENPQGLFDFSNKTDNVPRGEYAQYLAKEIVGENTNTGKPVFIQTIDSEAYLTMELNADENPSLEMIKGVIITDSAKIFKQAFAYRPDLNGLKLVWYMPVADASGNKKDEAIIKIKFSREKAAAMNWDNALTEIATTADEYWEHPSFARK